MIPQTDLALFKSVAHSPDVVMRELLSPAVAYNEDWIQSPTLKKCFRFMAQSVLSGRQISWLSLASGVSLDDDELEVLRQSWREGREDRVDLRQTVAALKADFIISSANSSIQEYYGRVKQDRGRAREHIDVLGLELSFISKDGLAYDSKPSSHLQDKELDRSGTWGDKDIDSMFSESWNDRGGRPSYGFVVTSMPSGHGKTTLAISLAAYGLAYGHQDRITVMSNEMPRSAYSRGVLRALRTIYGGEADDSQLQRMIDERMEVFGPGGEHGGMPVKSFELMRQILFWTSPQIAIMDSLNSVSVPQFANTNRISESQCHVIKADAFRDTCLEYNVLLYAPGNMSNELQTKLMQSPGTVNRVMLFGSQAYENAADYSFLGWRDKAIPYQQNIKRCKNRHGTSVGELFEMVYDTNGGYYRAMN